MVRSAMPLVWGRPGRAVGCRYPRAPEGICAEVLDLLIRDDEDLQSRDCFLGVIGGRWVAIQPSCDHVLEYNRIVGSFKIFLAGGVHVVGRNQVTEFLGNGHETVGISLVLVFGLVGTFPARQLRGLGSDRGEAAISHRDSKARFSSPVQAPRFREPGGEPVPEVGLPSGSSQRPTRPTWHRCQ
jgi:hypothetical protein